MLSVLYVDDEKTLLEIAKLFLEGGGEFCVDTIDSARAALDIMQKKSYDAIISDYQMPGMDGIGFLKQVRGCGNTVPFILFTGRGREEIVIQALNEGADFYLQKGGDPVPQFTELAHKIRLAVEKKKAEASIRDHELREQEIINFLPDATLAIDTNGTVIAWNRKIEEMTGVRADQMLGKGNFEYAIPFYGERRAILIDLVLSPEDVIRDRYSNIIRDGTMLAAETTHPRVKGNPRTLWGKASLLYDQNGRVAGAIEAIRDITERKAAETELIRARDVLEDRVNQRTADLYAANMQLQQEIENRKLIDSALMESEERFRILIEKAPEAILLFDADQNRNIIANARAEDLFGCPRGELLRGGVERFYLPDQPDGKPPDESIAMHRKRVLEGEELVFERRICDARGGEHLTEVRLVRLPPLHKKLVRVSFTDITERKMVERELRRNEERYREIVENDYQSILENIQDVFYRTNAEGKLVMVSHSGAKLLGYAGTEELIGMPAREFYADPREREDFLAVLMKDGEVSGIEVTLKHRNGTTVPVSTSSHVYYDADGKIAGVEGIFRNITRLKKVQEELRQSEELYRVLVEHIQDGAFLMQDGILIFCNEAFASMIGYTLKEVTGMPVPDLIAPEDRAVVMERQQARLAGRSQQESYRFHMLHKDGKTRVPVMLSVGIGTVRNRQAIIGTVRDIRTERIQGPELQKSEQQYRMLAEASRDLIFVVGRDDRMEFVNRFTASLLKIPAGEIPGRDRSSLFRGEQGRRQGEALRQVFGTGKTLHGEGPLDLDGDLHWFDYLLMPVTDAYGMVTSVIGVARDITDRKRIEQALQESERQYRTLTEASRDIIFVIGRDDRVEYINSHAAEMLGGPPDQIVGRERSSFFTGELGRRQAEALHRVLVTGKAGHSEGPMEISGARRWFDHYLMPITGADGTVVSVLGVSRDITGRKETEQALQESEEQYRHLVEQSLQGLTILQGGRPVYANHAMLEISGYSPDDLLAMTPEEFVAIIHPEDRDRMAKMFADRLEGREIPTENEFRFFRKDGKIRWVITHGVLIFCKGTPAIQATYFDITGRKRAEQALAESEERLRQVTETLTSVFYIHDRISDRFIYVSPAYEKIWKRSCQSLYHNQYTYLESVHPDDQPRLLDTIRQELEEGRYVDTEYRIQQPDGTIRWIHAKNFPIFDDSGTVYRVAGIAEDITSRHTAEEALRESEEKYRTLFEESNDAIFFADPATGILTGCNRMGEILTGISREELTGTPAADLYPPEAGNQNLQYFRKFAEGRTGSIETVIRGKNNMSIPVSINAVKVELGGRPFLMAIVRDITLQKETEQALREALQAFRESNRKLGLLSSVTRHDVINHLMILKGFVAFAKTQGNGEKFQYYIRRQEETIAQIEREILFTREYQEIGVMEPSWQNAAQCIRSAVSGIDLSGTDLMVGGLDTIEVRADPLLGKVFLNLVENALRHGGECLNSIRFSAGRNGDSLLIICEDNGPGVPSEEKELIFGRGYGKHTGFGLFLIREILSITGMTIRESGAPGTGARFVITVPGGAYRIAGNS